MVSLMNKQDLQIKFEAPCHLPKINLKRPKHPLINISIKTQFLHSIINSAVEDQLYHSAAVYSLET